MKLPPFVELLQDVRGRRKGGQGLLQCRGPLRLGKIVPHGDPAAAPRQLRKAGRLDHVAPVLLRSGAEVSPVCESPLSRSESGDHRHRWNRPRIEHPRPWDQATEDGEILIAQLSSPERCEDWMMEERKGQLLLQLRLAGW